MRPYLHTLLAASLLALSAAAVAADSDVLVSEGGQSVTVKDVDAFVARIPEPDRPAVMDNPERVNHIIMDILHGKLLAAQARELKLENDPVVQQQLALATNEVLSRARVEAHMKSIKVPDLTQLAKEEYLSHPADYSKPPVYDVQHVLIKPSAERTDEQAKALAEEVHKKAVADPGKFDALVEQYSEDQSKSNNKGVIKDATRPMFAPQFRTAVKTLEKKDQISDVTKTRFGYHVIRLVELKPSETQPFDQVKNQIVAKLRLQYMNKQNGEFLAKLDTPDIQVNAPLVDTLRSRYVAPGDMTPRDAAAKAAAQQQ